MDSIDALTFLLPVKDTLHSLHLEDCEHDELTSAKLLPFLPLPLLTKLMLYRSLSQPLDVFTLAVLTPPTKIFPALGAGSATHLRIVGLRRQNESSHFALSISRAVVLPASSHPSCCSSFCGNWRS